MRHIVALLDRPCASSIGVHAYIDSEGFVHGYGPRRQLHREETQEYIVRGDGLCVQSRTPALCPVVLWVGVDAASDLSLHGLPLDLYLLGDITKEPAGYFAQCARPQARAFLSLWMRKANKQVSSKGLAQLMLTVDARAPEALSMALALVPPGEKREALALCASYSLWGKGARAFVVERARNTFCVVLPRDAPSSPFDGLDDAVQYATLYAEAGAVRVVLKAPGWSDGALGAATGYRGCPIIPAGDPDRELLLQIVGP